MALQLRMGLEKPPHVLSLLLLPSKPVPPDFSLSWKFLKRVDPKKWKNNIWNVESRYVL